MSLPDTLVTIDIETTTDVDGVPDDAVPGLDARFGAVREAAIAVERPDGLQGTVFTVAAADPVAVHRNGVTTFSVPSRVVQEFDAAGYASATAVLVPSETYLLAELYSTFDRLPGDAVLLGWNSAVFDAPYLDDRAAVNRMESRFVLEPDPDVYVKYDPLPGHAGGYRVGWRQPGGRILRHLDLQSHFRSVADRLEVRHSLKPVASACGFDPVLPVAEIDGERVEVGRDQLHLVANADRWAYVLSDVRLPLQLARAFDDEMDLASHIDRVAS